MLKYNLKKKQSTYYFWLTRRLLKNWKHVREKTFFHTSAQNKFMINPKYLF